MHPVLETLQERYPDLQPCMHSIGAAYDVLRGAFATGGKLLVCGNGGSAADSEHIVGELMKSFQRQRPISDQMRERLMEQDAESGQYIANHLQGALPAITLTAHAALISAISNDVAADMVFAQQVYGYGSVGDALLAISTSGNSANVLHAIRVAKVMGMRVVGLTGRTGGKMSGLCDVSICAPYDDVSQIQERHLPIYHALCVMLEQEFFHA